jgi:pimeloyl-ACP methyl ester carboxylesterase
VQAQHIAVRRRVLSIDLRGHRESDVPEQGYSLDALPDDLVRVCDEAGISRAVFCGHSMAVALKVALRRPDFAAGVVLLDGAVLMPADVRDLLKQLADVVRTDAWRAALRGFSPVSRDQPPSAYGRTSRCRGTMRSRSCATSRPQIRRKSWAALGCPLIYVHNQIPTDLTRLQSVRPDAIIEEIHGVDHYQMLTTPEQVNALLDRFLELVG